MFGMILRYINVLSRSAFNCLNTETCFPNFCESAML